VTRLRGTLPWLAIALLAVAGPSVRGQVAADPQYLEARRLFDALDYENALRLLDQIVVALEARDPDDAVRRELLPGAYEMRARSRFGLGDQDGAKADFVQLLRANPAHVLTGQVSPRVVQIFDETLRETVAPLTLAVTPATAAVRLDGRPASLGTPIPVTVGDHVVSVELLGYRSVERTVTVEAGFASDLTIVLERTTPVVYILTSPPDVQVTINSVARGRTAPGPPPPSYADAIGRAGLAPANVSSPMVLTDLGVGSHLVELTRDCYVRTEVRVPIDQPDDYTVGPLRLQPAVARLTVRTSDTAAQVLVDGQPRGNAPLTIPDLCEGDHAVEVRTPAGRFFRRLRARTGEELTVEGTAKPAFALVSVSGQADGLSPDLRTVVERAFEPSNAITLFAPPAAQGDQALKSSQLPADWLAFDASRRPLGASANMVAATRRDVSTKLTEAFGAQGVASLTVLGRNHLTLALLAAGSSEPDVFELRLDQADSTAAAIGALDRPLTFFRPSIGLIAIDVADIAGAVITSVDANGPSAKAGLQAGDVIVSAGGRAVADASALTTLLAARAAGDRLAIEVRDRAGATRQAEVVVSMAPRVVGVSDQTQLVNRRLTSLRALLRGQHDAVTESVIRLNLAATLARVEAWSEARTELQRVNLPEGPGVGAGTVQYVLGLSAEGLGNFTEAEAAYKAAAASASGLTEDGPAVAELAAARLAELQRRTTR
jgi:hypothetical protein